MVMKVQTVRMVRRNMMTTLKIMTLKRMKMMILLWVLLMTKVIKREKLAGIDLVLPLKMKARK